MTKLMLIALGGAAGSLSRYGLGSWVDHYGGRGFSYGTLLVNMLGCFLFGVVVGLVERGNILPRHSDALLLVGFLGAFTTFSTFAYHNAGFATHGKLGYLALNLIAQNAVGILAVLGGLALARPN